MYYPASWGFLRKYSWWLITGTSVVGTQPQQSLEGRHSQPPYWDLLVSCGSSASCSLGGRNSSSLWGCEANLDQSLCGQSPRLRLQGLPRQFTCWTWPLP